MACKDEVTMSLYAELHRHLGGSVVPRVLWRYFQRNRPDLSDQFADYGAFEAFYTRPRHSLAEYLELHTLVESVQTREALPYFIYRLIRGAYILKTWPTWSCATPPTFAPPITSPRPSASRPWRRLWRLSVGPASSPSTLSSPANCSASTPNCPRR